MPNRSWIKISWLIIFADQLSKYLAASYLGLGQAKVILPFFNLTLAHNRGAAFSFLSGASGWQNTLFIVLTLIICVVLLNWLKSLPASDRWKCCAFSLVIGGAIGNLIDRIRLGYVVDFIDLHIGDLHWPIFNIADSAITIGVIILIVHMIFEKES